MRQLLGLLWALLLTVPAVAGELAPADSARARRVGVLPVPAFGYAPETGGYVGAVALFTLRLYPGDTLTRTSNAKIEVNFTQNRQRILVTEWTLLLRREKYLSQGHVGLLQFPELYWGVGNHTPDAQQERLDSRQLEARATVLRRLRPFVFAGPRVQLQRLSSVEAAPGGLLEQGTVAGSRGGLSSGAGLELVYDGRDNLLNPRQRGYLRLAYTQFGRALGSDFRFTRTELDARRYLRLRPRLVLAGQLVGTLHTGAPPFRMLALLGSDADMRGYYRGRFRDQHYAATQLELRQTLFWRLGVVGFAGAGQVASRLGGFGLGELKPSAGLGLRILVDRRENVNMRFDYAVGQGSTGFYVSFGEAF